MIRGAPAASQLLPVERGPLAPPLRSISTLSPASLPPWRSRAWQQRLPHAWRCAAGVCAAHAAGARLKPSLCPSRARMVGGFVGWRCTVGVRRGTRVETHLVARVVLRSCAPTLPYTGTRLRLNRSREAPGATLRVFFAPYSASNCCTTDRGVRSQHHACALCERARPATTGAGARASLGNLVHAFCPEQGLVFAATALGARSSQALAPTPPLDYNPHRGTHTH